MNRFGLMVKVDGDRSIAALSVLLFRRNYFKSENQIKIKGRNDEICTKPPEKTDGMSVLKKFSHSNRLIGSDAKNERDSGNPRLDAVSNKPVQSNRIVSSENTVPNTKVESKESVKISEETKNFGTQPSNELTSQESFNVHLQTPSSYSIAHEGKIEQKNVDILLLNLRFDSFEKRFDNALKEIGAISAEISNIKSEIKELKEALDSNGKYKETSKKKNDGMLQTILPFGSNSTSSCMQLTTGSASSEFITIARPNESMDMAKDEISSRGSRVRESPSSEESKTKARILKRKLSKTFSPEAPKRFADGPMDFEDIINRVKVEAIDINSFKYDEDDYVEVYTDGSVRSNGQKDAKAGIGIWFGDNHPLNVAEAVIGSPTNNTAEIQAARVAVQLAIKAGIKKLKILTDSEFLINCATKWIHRWKKNGWTLRDGGPVKHRKELEKLDKIASEISIRWEKVAGHSGIKGNETADRLANAGAIKYSG